MNKAAAYALITASSLAAIGSSIIVYAYDAAPMLRLTAHGLTLAMLVIILTTHKDMTPSRSPKEESAKSRIKEKAQDVDFKVW